MMGEDKRGQGNNFLFSIEIWLYVVNGFKQSTVYDLHQFPSFWTHSLKWTVALLLLLFFVWHSLLFLNIFQITLCYCLDYSSKLTLLWPNVDHGMGFLGGSVVKNLPARATGDAGLISGSGRSPGGGNGNPLQYSCLENPMDKKSLACCSPWGLKESDAIEWLNWKRMKTFILTSQASIGMWQALQSYENIQMQYSSYRIDMVTKHLFTSGLK